MRFIADNFVYIAGIIGILGYGYEIYHNIKRKGRKRAENLKTSIFLGVSIVTMFGAFYLFQSKYEIKHSTTAAAEQIVSADEKCLSRAAGKSPPPAAAKNPDALACLAYAFQTFAPKDAPEAVSARFYQDVELGNELLSNHDVADTLWANFGINWQSFLGTGYSMPSIQGGGVENQNTLEYGRATAREYLVENTCAERMPAEKICPSRDSTAWAWRVPVQSLDTMTVEDVVFSLPPDDGANEYSDFVANWKKGAYADPILIRFARAPADKYLGTVGRSEAKYVFFTNYEDVKSRLLSEAFRLSGAKLDGGNKLDGSNRNTIMLVWISAPFSAAGHRYLATWSNVFYLLRNFDATSQSKMMADAAPGLGPAAERQSSARLANASE